MADERSTDELERDRRKLERLSTLLDSQFRIPGTGIRFGVDALIGIVPGIGDAAGLVAATGVIVQAADLGARGFTLARMVANAAVDGVVGSVPVLGTVFDVAFKANQRNVALLQRHVEDPESTARASKRTLVVATAAVITVLVVLVVAMLAAVAALLAWIF